MQTVKSSLNLPYPMDLVLQVSHFDMLHNLPGYTKMLEMKKIELIKFDEHEDGSHDVEFTMQAEDKLPAIVKRVVNPDMLVWRQVGRWNPKTLTLDLKVLPAFFPNLVNIKAQKRYAQKNGSVLMELAARIDIKIPAVGGIMEKVVVSEVKKSHKIMFGKIESEIKKRHEG